MHTQCPRAAPSVPAQPDEVGQSARGAALRVALRPRRRGPNAVRPRRRRARTPGTARCACLGACQTHATRASQVRVGRCRYRTQGRKRTGQCGACERVNIRPRVDVACCRWTALAARDTTGVPSSLGLHVARTALHCGGVGPRDTRLCSIALRGACVWPRKRRLRPLLAIKLSARSWGFQFDACRVAVSHACAAARAAARAIGTGEAVG